MAAVQEELEAAFGELKKFETEAENAAARERASDARRAQAAADEAAINAHIRKTEDALR
jgi:hypothetical protein